MASPHSHHHHHHHSHVSSRGAGGFAEGTLKDRSQQKLQSVAQVFWLNLLFAVVELVGGLWTGSYAILSDALHDFGDSLSLGLAYFLERQARRPSNRSFTYGFRRFSVMSAVFTGAVLIVGSLWIISRSLMSLGEGREPHAPGMIGLALLGLVVNALSFFRLRQGHSLSEKMLQWHFIEDILGWALVLFVGIVMLFVQAPFLDPLLAVFLSGWVLWNVVKNLKSAFEILLQATPSHLSAEVLREELLGLEGVRDVHHLHLWTVDGEVHVLTAHLLLESQAEVAPLKLKAKKLLAEKYQIFEAVLETEYEGDLCADPQHSEGF
ncbi:MAG: cation diffusion facilitator family transporter [Bdellovibrio sp.]